MAKNATENAGIARKSQLSPVRPHKARRKEATLHPALPAQFSVSMIYPGSLAVSPQSLQPANPSPPQNHRSVEQLSQLLMPLENVLMPHKNNRQRKCLAGNHNRPLPDFTTKKFRRFPANLCLKPMSKGGSMRNRKILLANRRSLG